MKTVLTIIILAFFLVCAGCGSETTTAVGGGILGGFAASETLKGVKADIEFREAALVARYNELVAVDAKAEDLAEVQRQINQLQYAKQGVGAVENVAKTDWTDPKAAGGAIGTIAALAYAFVKRKELVNTVAGVKSFRAISTEETKQKLDAALLSKGVAT